MPTIRVSEETRDWVNRLVRSAETDYQTQDDAVSDALREGGLPGGTVEATVGELEERTGETERRLELLKEAVEGLQESVNEQEEEMHYRTDRLLTGTMKIYNALEREGIEVLDTE